MGESTLWAVFVLSVRKTAFESTIWVVFVLSVRKTAFESTLGAVFVLSVRKTAFESTFRAVFVLSVLFLVCDSVSEQSKVAFARVVRPDFPESIGDLPCGYNVFLTS